MTPREALKIGALTMKLGEVRRATAHPDGQPETDTTHTVMLALLVLRTLPQHYDVGLALGFALVHDLAEAYAGDTNTARGLTAEERAAKKVREELALERIRADLPEIAEWIDRYEAMDTPEAAFVHILDKCCPKVCHALNLGRTLDALGMTPADVEAAHRKQGAELRVQHPDEHQAHKLFGALSDAAERAIQPMPNRHPKEDCCP